MNAPDTAVDLREPVAADAGALADMVLRSMSHLSPWMPWATSSYDEASASAWIEGLTGDAHRYFMVDAAGQIVGVCGLNSVDDVNKTANLGYWVAQDQAGNGFSTQATRQLAAIGHAADLHRLEIVMSVRNTASRRVAEKAGATFEGTVRGALLLHGEYHDAEVWSLLPGD